MTCTTRRESGVQAFCHRAKPWNGQALPDRPGKIRHAPMKRVSWGKQVIGTKFVLYRESHSKPKEKRIQLVKGKK